MATGRPTTIRPNDLPPGTGIWFSAKDGKQRPGVVLRVHPKGSNPAAAEELLVVIAGTKSVPLAHHGDRYEEVEHNSREGKALRLTFDTWFKDSKVEVIPRSRARASGGLAPPSLFLRLEALIPLAMLPPAPSGPVPTTPKAEPPKKT